MSIRAVRAIGEPTSRARLDSELMLRLVKGGHAQFEPRDDWQRTVLEPLGVKRHIGAQDCLFSVGDKATHYYFVLSGELLLHRHPRRGNPAVRFAEHGILFIYDCDGSHAADCHATRDSVVIAIDRKRLETLAQLDPALKGILNCVHASELSMILASLGVCSPDQRDEPHAGCRSGALPGRLTAGGRWQPYVAHRARTA